MSDPLLAWTATANPANTDERFAMPTFSSGWLFLETSPFKKVFRRCVRGAGFTGTVRAAGGHVEDTRTNLMWQSGGLPAPASWVTALAHCEALTLDGFADWRLPSNKELFSIVDDTRTAPLISPAFASRPAEMFWTSTPSVRQGTVGAYAVDFASGTTGDAVGVPYTRALQVRCVRGP